MHPVAFSLPHAKWLWVLSGLEIRWYGIAMALSMLLGAMIAARLLKKQGYDGEAVWDGLVWVILFGIAGARLFYVLTNLPDYFSPTSNPLEVFAVWHGGLSIHGGLLLGGLATYYFFNSRKIPFLYVADAFVPGVCLGIILVRIGNFMNGDILGYKWNGPWAMNFPYDSFHTTDPKAIVLRHPTEIYGLLVGVVCLAVAAWMWSSTYIRKKFCPGATFMGLLVSYSLARSIIEDPFRDVPLPWKVIDPVHYQCGLFTSSQLASIPIILIGIWGLTQVCNWEKARIEAGTRGIASDEERQTRQQRRARMREDRKRDEDSRRRDED